MKINGTITLRYSYYEKRSGAKYTLDGRHFMNNGEFLEAAAKALHGLEPRKDGNTPFDKGSDVPEYNASVKSSSASLTNRQLAPTFDESLRTYFEKVASSEFWYVVKDGEQLTVYKMNAATFERFLRKFAGLNERGVIRLKATSSKTIAWLEANCRH